MLDEEQVTALSVKATEVYGMYMKDLHGQHQLIDDMLNNQLRKLSNRVDHDHMQGVVYCNVPDGEPEAADDIVYTG